MKIEIETGSYNERRCGKPWIAVVNFSTSAQGEYRWGEWVGDARNGGAGTLLVDANPGDIIAQGQKDFRKMRNSAPVFYHVESDGSLSKIGDKGKAYSFWRGMQDGMAEKEAERMTEDGRPLRMIDVESQEPAGDRPKEIVPVGKLIVKRDGTVEIHPQEAGGEVRIYHPEDILIETQEGVHSYKNLLGIVL